ncbi:hypothetical protein Tco_0411444 [Tanacetum coccineum]
MRGFGEKFVGLNNRNEKRLQGIVAAGLTLYRANSTDELAFLSLGGVSTTLSAKVYYLGKGTSESRIIEWVGSDQFILMVLKGASWRRKGVRRDLHATQ